MKGQNPHAAVATIMAMTNSQPARMALWWRCATADAAGNALEGRSEPDEATVHSRAGSAATRDELRTTEPAAKPQGDQP